MRTFEEIKIDLDHANSSNDAASLMECADELDALATTEAEAVAHNARGWALFIRGDYSAALEHYHRSLALHEKLGNHSGVAGITGNIGNVHFSTGNYPAALEHFQRALAVHQELGDRSRVAGTTNNIGMVHVSTGNYPAGLEHFHRALVLCEEIGHQHFAANVSGNIGNVYQRTGNYPAALEHFHRALVLFEKLGNRSGVANTTLIIGNVHQSTGNYPAALEYSNRALAIHDELGNPSSVALAIGNIVSAMILSGEHAQAEALLQTMDALQIDEPSVVVHREQSRASLQELHGTIDEARATLRAALLIAQEHMLAPMQAEIHKALRDLAQKQNDFASYIEHNNEFTRINEEVNGKDTATKLAMQEKQREIDAKDREHQKHLAVLHSTLPKHIADRVARGETVNDQYDHASVIFLDIVGFTTISDRIPSGHVVHLLEQIFTTLDAVCEKHDVIKIKTIGDSYMAASFESVTNAATCALDMITSLDALEITMPPSLGDTSWTKDVGDIKVRIGIHCGPLTAGVIGTQRMQYDVWGDTVNVASRMESTSEPGRIHVSEAFAKRLEALVTRHSSLVTIDRGSIDIKGKGPMHTYWLEDRAV
jgi:adenylate cyclase